MSHFTVISIDSANDVISNLPSTSLSSYGLGNGQDEEEKKINLFNRDSIKSNVNQNDAANMTSDDERSIKESSFYSPRSNYYYYSHNQIKHRIAGVSFKRDH